MAKTGRPPLRFIPLKKKGEREPIDLNKIVPLFEKLIFKSRVAAELGIDVSTIDDYCSKKEGDSNYNPEFTEAVKAGEAAAHNMLKKEVIDSVMDGDKKVNNSMLIWACKLKKLCPPQEHLHQVGPTLIDLVDQANIPAQEEG
ncbi:MAG: hypothetical protein JKY48_01355 [Flavobacteriales bacterium]|nr:hypothetical protein [Flavobacteriales bacterium]